MNQNGFYKVLMDFPVCIIHVAMNRLFLSIYLPPLLFSLTFSIKKEIVLLCDKAFSVMLVFILNLGYEFKVTVMVI